MVGHVTESTAGLLAQLPGWVTLIRANNPNPMTLDGTNTWVLSVPDSEERIVIDPGPLEEPHLAAIAASGHVTTVITTHFHHDHTEGVPRLLELCPQARVWDGGAGETHWTGAGAPAGSGLQIRPIATPGHTADSIALVAGVGDERVVLTGDTILGRGTTVVAYPDGDLGDYLRSLGLLELLGALPVLPGHGPALTDCAASAAYYLRHRLARLEQVKQAVAAGADTPSKVIEVVYADVDKVLWPAAELSVRAQLAYLERESGDPAPRLDRP
jgi:glyoxylase-like metal-dependent hydrolase (beta-lactamase superfamily II)